MNVTHAISLHGSLTAETTELLVGILVGGSLVGRTLSPPVGFPKPPNGLKVRSTSHIQKSIKCFSALTDEVQFPLGTRKKVKIWSDVRCSEYKYTEKKSSLPENHF